MIEPYYWLTSNYHKTTMFPDEAWLIHQPHFVDIGPGTLKTQYSQLPNRRQ